MILECRNLEKSYDGRPLFSGLNLTLEKGEKVGILGPSGKGKSTLLKMVAGLVHPDRGRIRDHGARIGYVFQEPRLMPWYSALDNVAMPLVSLGHSQAAARREAARFLDDMGLSGFLNHYPGALSGGMNQRVAIARALAVSPGLLLLDEPFTGLDPDLRQSVRTRMAGVLARTGAGVIHVTHTREELMEGTARIYTLTTRGLVLI